MIESHWTNGYHEQAFELLQKMRQRVSNAAIEYYLDARIVQALYQAQGLQNATHARGDDIEEELDEDDQ